MPRKAPASVAASPARSRINDRLIHSRQLPASALPPLASCALATKLRTSISVRQIPAGRGTIRTGQFLSPRAREGRCFPAAHGGTPALSAHGRCNSRCHRWLAMDQGSAPRAREGIKTQRLVSRRIPDKTIMLTDGYGLPLSTTSFAARDAYVEACEAKLTMYPGAIEAFDRAIAADPGFALPHAARAHALLERGNAAAAREAMASANRLAAGLPAREAGQIAYF